MLLSLKEKFQGLTGNSESPQLTMLRNFSLFSKISPVELRAISSFLHRRNYMKDEIIFDQNEEGQAIYFILEGKVLVCLQGKSLDGTIATLGAGQFFGEMALLDNLPRMAQARAAEDCTLDVLFREDFVNLLHTHTRIAPKLYLELARMMAERLRQQANNNVL
jgi:CRP-like cAMP-binding protein